MISMKKTASAGLIVSVCLLLTLTTTTGAQAKAEKVYLTFGASLVDQYGGQQWLDSDGILHIRGLNIEQECDSGDVLGTLYFVGNANIDPVTGDGTCFGTWRWVVDWSEEGITGTAEGRYSGRYRGWSLSAKGIGFGDEGTGLEGWKIDCSNQQVASGEYEYTVLLLNPRG